MIQRSNFTAFIVFTSFVLSLSVALLVSVQSARAQEQTSERPTGSIYKEEPPDLYPEESTVPEPGKDFPAYNQVVDNPYRKNLSRAGWTKAASKPGSYGEDYWVAKSAKARTAAYKVKIPATDVYSVFAWWPRKAGKRAKARFGVRTVSGMEWSTVDQGKDGGYWVPIGEYKMKKGNRFSIRIRPGGGGRGRPVADAVAVVRGVYDFPPDPPSLPALDTGDKAGGPVTSSNLEERSVFSGQSVRRISRRAIMRRARTHIGTPYKLGDLSVCKPYKWEDCSCFTRLVFRKWRVLPDSPSAQLRADRMSKVRRTNLRRGDLVFHDTTGDGRMTAYDHVSIYAGNGYVIHANSYYKYRKVHRQEMKWLANYKGARRVRY